MKKFTYVAVILIILVGIIIIILAKKPETNKQIVGESNSKVLPSQKPVTSADNAPSGTIHNLPVPAPVQAARKAAANLLGIPEGEAIVMSAFEKEWPDSCLGLSNKEEMCSQVITNGYEVTVQGNGKEIIYRTNQDGSVIRQQI